MHQKEKDIKKQFSFDMRVISCIAKQGLRRGWGWLNPHTFFLGTKKGDNVNVRILNVQLRIFKENLPI